MIRLDEDFLLADYIDISIHISSRVLPINLLEKVSFHLRKSHNENKIENTLIEEVN